MSEPAPWSDTRPSPDMGQLSTVPEEESIDIESAGSCLQHFGRQLHDFLRAAPSHADLLISADAKPVEHCGSSDCR